MPDPFPAKGGKPLSECPPQYQNGCYFGRMSRDTAETLLNNATVGSYIVRESERLAGDYALSMKLPASVKHFRIFYTDDEHYVNADNRYATIENLVCLGLGHYLVTEAPLYEAPNDCLRAAAEVQQQQTTDASSHSSPGLSSPAADPNAPPAILRDHVFKSHTFAKPTWCDWCKEFMWGLVTQGVQCKECGYNSHKMCADLTGGCSGKASKKN
eukprot:Opistho-2@21980